MNVTNRQNIKGINFSPTPNYKRKDEIGLYRKYIRKSQQRQNKRNRIILEELPNNRKIGMNEGYKAVEYQKQ